MERPRVYEVGGRRPYSGRLPDFTRQENKIRGNRRTLRRQYAARNWTFVRVLPGIAGYCRVVGPWEKRGSGWLMAESRSSSPGLSPGRGVAFCRMLSRLWMLGVF